MSTSLCQSRVLIADDEPVVADTLALILDQHGFETKAVYSGEAAVESALALRPDVLITDFLMAEMNGIETALRISAIRPGGRIILGSGNVGIIPDMPPGVEKQIGNPIEVLSKPMHPALLLARLAH
jgi:CheY-like chemotaxis protein